MFETHQAISHIPVTVIFESSEPHKMQKFNKTPDPRPQTGTPFSKNVGLKMTKSELKNVLNFYLVYLHNEEIVCIHERDLVYGRICVFSCKKKSSITQNYYNIDFPTRPFFQLQIYEGLGYHRKFI